MQAAFGLVKEYPSVGDGDSSILLTSFGDENALHGGQEAVIPRAWIAVLTVCGGSTFAGAVVVSAFAIFARGADAFSGARTAAVVVLGALRFVHRCFCRCSGIERVPGSGTGLFASGLGLRRGRRHICCGRRRRRGCRRRLGAEEPIHSGGDKHDCGDN